MMRVRANTHMPVLLFYLCLFSVMWWTVLREALPYMSDSWKIMRQPANKLSSSVHRQVSMNCVWNSSFIRNWLTAELGLTTIDTWKMWGRVCHVVHQMSTRSVKSRAVEFPQIIFHNPSVSPPAVLCKVCKWEHRSRNFSNILLSSAVCQTELNSVQQKILPETHIHEHM